jgi:hypothetical protein
MGRELDRSKGAGKTHDAERDPGHYVDLYDDGAVMGVLPLAKLPDSREAFDTELRAKGFTQYKAGCLFYSIVDGWQQIRKVFAYWRVLTKARRRRPRRNAPGSKRIVAYGRRSRCTTSGSGATTSAMRRSLYTFRSMTTAGAIRPIRTATRPSPSTLFRGRVNKTQSLSTRSCSWGPSVSAVRLLNQAVHSCLALGEHGRGRTLLRAGEGRRLQEGRARGIAFATARLATGAPPFAT